jgi:hypothetical protein
MLPSNNFGFHC